MPLRKILLTCCTWIILMGIATGGYARSQQILEVEINGMSCSFCVYGAKKSLMKVPGVQSVVISLKYRRGRIKMRPSRKADTNLIRKQIIKAGFTPGTIRSITLKK